MAGAPPVEAALRISDGCYLGNRLVGKGFAGKAGWWWGSFHSETVSISGDWGNFKRNVVFEMANRRTPCRPYAERF